VRRRSAKVSWQEPDGPVRGVVLVLHGGKVRSLRRPHRWQLAVARMLPFARSLARAGRDHGLAVGLVLYRVRGWNGELASPVGDVRAVLDGVRERFGAVPVALVGHSMGGRTALRCADDASVRAVVALAPWIESGEPVDRLDDVRLLILHGDRDRWTDPRASLRYAQAVAAAGTGTVGRIELRGEGHTMLGRARLWHDLTTAFVLRALGSALGKAPDGQSAATGSANVVVGRLEAGQVLLTV
jgi:alpha-beta hydrolase superfamily lysophospholipase